MEEEYKSLILEGIKIYKEIERLKEEFRNGKPANVDNAIKSLIEYVDLAKKIENWNIAVNKFDSSGHKKDYSEDVSKEKLNSSGLEDYLDNLGNIINKGGNL